MKKQEILASATVLTAFLIAVYPAASLSQQGFTPPQTAVPAPAATIPAKKALPDGPGKDVFVRSCSKCHSTDIAASKRKSSDEWTDTLIDMRNKGATPSDEELEQILKYLVDNFGPV